MDEFAIEALKSLRKYTSGVVSELEDGAKVSVVADYDSQYFNRRFEFEIDSEARTVTVKNILSGIQKGSPLHHHVFDAVRHNEFIVRFTPTLSEGSISVVYDWRKQDDTEPAAKSVTYSVEKLASLIFVIYERVYRVAPRYTLTHFGDEQRTMMGIAFITKDRAAVDFPSGIDPFKSGAKGDFAITLPDKHGDYACREAFWGEVFPDNVYLPILSTVHNRHYYLFVESLDDKGKPQMKRIDLSDLQERINRMVDIIEVIVGGEARVHLVSDGRELPEGDRKIRRAVNAEEARMLLFRPTHPVVFHRDTDFLDMWIAFIDSIIGEDMRSTIFGKWVPIESQLTSIRRGLTVENKEKMKELAAELARARELISNSRFAEKSFEGTVAAKMLAREKYAELYGTHFTLSSEGEQRLVSNTRKISRSGAGLSVYLGNEELKAIELHDKAMVSVIQDFYGRRRILIEPIED